MGAEATLGAIIRTCGAELHRQHPLSAHKLSVMRSLADCRTAALRGHRDRCDRCGYEHVFWNSCRDRHCPACGSEARERWLDARRDEVLDVPYFHAVFTVPQELHVFALVAPELFYAILLRAAGQALIDVGKTKLRAHFGVLTVLHTWGQTLVFHPHVHCVIPGGGFSLDGRRLIRASYPAASRRWTRTTHPPTELKMHACINAPASNSATPSPYARYNPHESARLRPTDPFPASGVSPESLLSGNHQTPFDCVQRVDGCGNRVL